MHDKPASLAGAAGEFPAQAPASSTIEGPSLGYHRGGASGGITSAKQEDVVITVMQALVNVVVHGRPVDLPLDAVFHNPALLPQA